MNNNEINESNRADSLLKRGTLIRGIGSFYTVRDSAHQEYTLRCKKKFRRDGISPLVGDEVLFSPGQGEEHGWLEEILPRKTECLRPPVANVTKLVIMTAPVPEPDLLLVDRQISRAYAQGMDILLVVNKCDLNPDTAEQMRKEYHTAANDNVNTLHGGFTGIDRALWTVQSVSDSSITLTILDPDGSEGWPGNLRITLTYTLTPDDEFKVEFKAETDAPTLCNLTQHTFFNLTGDASRSIEGHILQIDAPHYLPVDDKLIPTGEIRPVEGTPFDFREGKPIGQDIDAAGGYDHNWCLAEAGGIRRIASLYEPVSGRRMEVHTDQCGMQFYSGNFFDGSYAGKGGRPIGHRCALALETQAWPDAIHHPGFPDTVLRPGETYSHTCIYKFVL